MSATLICKTLNKIKCNKAANHHSLDAESCWERVELARQLTEAVFSCGAIQSDWDESFILNLYKGKGKALERGNYHCLKRTDQVMKLLERVLDFFIHEMVNIDEMQFSFVSGKDTTDTIFIVRQLQEKYITVAKNLLYFAFVDSAIAVRSCVAWGKFRKPLPVLTTRHP